MRTFGRVYDAFGNPERWQVITTDENGHDDAVWVTTLIQCLRLNLGESPFHADMGVPAHQSILSQVYPDFYVAYMQKFFSPYFAALTVSRQPTSFQSPDPVYDIGVITNAGVSIALEVPQ